MKVKKGLLAILALCFTALICVAGGVGCSVQGDEHVQSGVHVQSDEQHTHSYIETEIAPNCTEDGYTLHKCECGNEYKDNFVKALGHTGGTASCTQKAVCELCHQEYGEEPSGHVGEGTCTVKAICTECGEEYGGDGHKYDIHVEGKKETCTEVGVLEHYECSVCGDSSVDDTEKMTMHTDNTEEKTWMIPASGHQIKNIEETASTCNMLGCIACIACTACKFVWETDWTEIGYYNEHKNEIDKPLDPTNHPTDAILEIPKKESTCCKQGNIACKGCNDCGYLWYSDGTGIGYFDEDNVKNTVFLPLESEKHKYIEFKQSYTCEKDGYIEHYECCDCGTIAIWENGNYKKATETELWHAKVGGKCEKDYGSFTFDERYNYNNDDGIWTYKCYHCGFIMGTKKGTMFREGNSRVGYDLIKNGQLYTGEDFKQLFNEKSSLASGLTEEDVAKIGSYWWKDDAEGVVRTEVDIVLEMFRQMFICYDSLFNLDPNIDYNWTSIAEYITVNTEFQCSVFKKIGTETIGSKIARWYFDVPTILNSQGTDKAKNASYKIIEAAWFIAREAFESMPLYYYVNSSTYGYGVKHEIMDDGINDRIVIPLCLFTTNVFFVKDNRVKMNNALFDAIDYVRKEWGDYFNSVKNGDFDREDSWVSAYPEWYVACDIAGDVSTYGYDYESEDYIYTQTVMGGLIKDMFVCEGYAQMMTMMFSVLGIDCLTACGGTARGLHAWTYVKLDGYWYCLDACWGVCEPIEPEYFWDHIYEGVQKGYGLKLPF